MNMSEVIAAIMDATIEQYKVVEKIIEEDPGFRENPLHQESYDAICLLFRTFAKHIAYIWWMNTEETDRLHSEAGVLAWSNVQDERIHAFLNEQAIQEGIIASYPNYDPGIWDYVFDKGNKKASDTGVNAMLNAANALK